MKVIYPPNIEKIEGKSIFLAGTIDNGNSEDWQQMVIDSLQDYPVTIFNPRRLDWNSNWEPIASNLEFRKQVEWELDHLEKADIIIMYFAPRSKSPISLLELGIFKDKNILVITTDNFYRSGNVEITCERYSIPFFNNWDDVIKRIKSEI